MQVHLEQFSVMRMAKVIAVSRSGFYYWLKHRHEIKIDEILILSLREIQ